MKDIFLDYEDISNLEPLTYKNSGRYGACYKYEDGVLKIFRVPLYGFIKENVRNNLKRKSEFIMYPERKLFLTRENPQFYGYKCKKAPGYSFNDIKEKVYEEELDISFDDFLTAYYDRFIRCIKKEDVIMCDIKPEHIFWDYNLYLIDTDFYTKNNFVLNSTKDKVNISKINNSLLEFFNYFLEKRFLSINIDCAKKSFLEKFIKEIRKTTNYEVNSLKELNNYKFVDSEEKRLRGFVYDNIGSRSNRRW